MESPPTQSAEPICHFVQLQLEEFRLQAYRSAAAEGFDGDLAAFLHTAADTLAEPLGHPVKPPADEKLGIDSPIRGISP